MRSLRSGYRLLILLLLMPLGFVPADQATFAQTTPIGSVVDANGDVGETSDLVIGQAGLGLIAYFDRISKHIIQIIRETHSY